MDNDTLTMPTQADYDRHDHNNSSDCSSDTDENAPALANMRVGSAPRAAVVLAEKTMNKPTLVNAAALAPIASSSTAASEDAKSTEQQQQLKCRRDEVIENAERAIAALENEILPVEKHHGADESGGEQRIEAHVAIESRSDEDGVVVVEEKRMDVDEIEKPATARDTAEPGSSCKKSSLRRGLGMSVNTRITQDDEDERRSAAMMPPKSPIEVLMSKMHELVQKYSRDCGDATEKMDEDEMALASVDLMRRKIREQDAKLAQFAEQDASRQADMDHLRKSVLSLQQDLMRLMTIVEMQMQMPPMQLGPPPPSHHALIGTTPDYQRLLGEVTSRSTGVKPDQNDGDASSATLTTSSILSRRFTEIGRKAGSSELTGMAMDAIAERHLQVKLLEATQPLISPIDSYASLMKESLSPQRKRVKLSKLGKRPWTPEEDNALAVAVQQAGASDWSAISRILPGRCGKQCRERWVNHLSPSVNKDAWTEEEDEIIFRTREKIGNHWADIARLLPGRTDNAVKNRFYSTMRRRVRQQRNLTRAGSVGVLPPALPTPTSGTAEATAPDMLDITMEQATQDSPRPAETVSPRSDTSGEL